MSLPNTMRALIQTSLDGPGGLVLTHDVPVPKPRRGEVLIRVAAAGVNFVDVLRARGTFGDNPVPPFVAGFEAAGEVVAVGEAVNFPTLGMVVFVAGAGAFAEYMALPAAAAVPVPSGWQAEQALGLAINWPTAFAALELGRLVAGETVLVHAAAGATGQAAVRLAKHRGARVIGVASASKHEVVSQWADHVLDARAPELGSAVRELTGGLGADLVIESTGGKTFDASLAATKRVTGRVVVLGLPAGKAAISNWQLVYEHPVQLVGFNLGALIQAAPQLFGQVWKEPATLIAAGVVTPSHPTMYPLANGGRALAELEDRATSGKLGLLA